MGQINDNNSEREMEKSLPYTRIYSDSNGNSHFSNEKTLVELKEVKIAKTPLYFSELINSNGARFYIFPVGWEADWHPAPRRQYYICLSGDMQVETSDGESRSFHTGDVILLEDLFGKGHKTQVIGPEQSTGVFVWINQ